MDRRRHAYQRLQSDDTTRILTLDPGKKDEPLTGTLETVPVSSAGNYEALSYVWAEPGPSNCPHTILVRDGDHGEGLLTLRGGSIFGALRQSRLPDRPRRIWADQCCINQDDRAERSQQVQFMNRIYRDAAHVLVWLGLDTNNEAASAFALVHELDEALSSRPVDGGARDPDTIDLEQHVRENQKALQALTGRSWFKRGWVVQEIGTGTKATMMWGDATMDWDTLASVCERLKGYHHLRSTLNITTSDISFLHRRFVEPDEQTHHANRFNFVYELQRARHVRFSDDRDRVFAFLGHYSVRSRHPLACGPVSIAADYTKSVEQTYVDVAVHVLRAHPAAACIVLAAVQHPRQHLPSSAPWLRDKQHLPSWVPDWRCRLPETIILAEPICPHRAHGDSAAQLEIVAASEQLVLRIHGVEVDAIEACSRPLTSIDLYAKRTPGTVERLWRGICRKQKFNLDDGYLNGQPAFFAFMQTLSNGCVQAAGHDCTAYHDVSDRVWLRKAARYIVETVETPDGVSDEVRRAAEGAGRESSHQEWSRWATSASEGRVFARTGKGYYVLGPLALEEGDVVCVLLGSKVPFCLRPMGARYLLVGECYVHGLMKGEAMAMVARDQLFQKIFDIV